MKHGSTWTRLVGFVAATAFAALGSGFAQDAPAVNVAESAELGSYLVDGEGMSLYLFLPDEQGASTCEGDCAEAWPPVVVDGQIAFGTGVDLGLLGTAERPGGTAQLTYGGWPLYGFAQDQEPGDVVGHGVNDVWFLVDPVGEAIEVASEAGEGGDMAFEEKMELGASVFSRQCASCHGAEGDEALASHVVILADNSRAVGTASRVLRVIMRGGAYMPRLGDALSDEEIASVATYIRNSWGNEHDPISVQEVTDLR